MPNKLESRRLATSFAIWSALFMLIIWLLANMGIYVSAAMQMAKWHAYFNLSFSGLIWGITEAALVSYLLVYVFVWIYNKVGS